LNDKENNDHMIVFVNTRGKPLSSSMWTKTMQAIFKVIAKTLASGAYTE